MTTDQPLSENIEDYLETILALQTEKTVARSKDIADALDIKRGSVTGMLKKLAVKELINYEPYGYVTLTPAGKKIAREIQARHIGIKDFLVRILKLDEADAEHTACRMEHAMDRETFARFMEFIDFIDNDCPRCGENWLNAYQAGTGPETPNCDLCKKKSRPGKA